MKNNNKKFLFIIFSFFAFSSIIFAIGDGNPEKDLICEKITENPQSQWQTDWNARLKICDNDNPTLIGFSTFGGSGVNSFDGITSIRDQQLSGSMESADAKSSEQTTFTRCNKDDPNVKITAKASCTYTVTSSSSRVVPCSSGGTGCRPNGNTGPHGEAMCICSSSSSSTKSWNNEFTFTGNDEPSTNYFTNACNQAVGSSNCTCSVEFTLTCPVYKCTPKDEELNVCTPTFTTANGDPAYCVNPNQGFDSAAGYRVDTNFDVSKCSSSRGTVDCGFANILIESAWQTQKNNYPISEQDTQLALRLWGVHSGQAGYYDLRTGVANVVSQNGVCNRRVTYISDNAKNGIINVYKITHDYIMNYLFNSIKSEQNNYIDASKSNTYFNKITCSSAPLGLVCGEGTYRNAFSLFFSSYFGNDKMEEHLSELVGIDTNAEPTDVEIVTDGEESRLELSFPHKIVTEKKLKYNCNKIDTYTDLTDTEKAYIKQYCNVIIDKWYTVDSQGNKNYVYCRPDKDNKVAEECDGIINDENAYFDGSKGTVEHEIIPFAVCDEEIKELYNTYHVIIRTPVSRTKNTVDKYVSCSNKDNQILFSFGTNKNTDNSSDYNETEQSWNSPKDYEIKVTCSGGCDNYNLRESYGKCNSNATTNGYYSGYVKDPSLSCIANMGSNERKNYYDYSSYFGVNTDLCRVYCSDEVDYYLADRINSASGETFTYDIKPFEAFNTETKKLSSGIKVKRTCVSQIFYDNNSFKKDNSWKDKYGITENDLKNAGYSTFDEIDNWKSLFAVLALKNYKEGQRTENLNELIYDLYNCNFIKDMPSNINKPKDNKVGNVFKNIQNLYSENNNYGFAVSSKNDDIWSSNIEYKGGAQYIDNNNYVGTNKSDIEVDKTINSDVENLNIKYCTGDVNDCLNYSSTKEDYNLSSFDNNNSIGKNDVASVSGKSFSTSFKNIINTEIPKNDFAAFEVTSNIGFYNNSKFETESYTGRVRKALENSSDLIKLDDYTYPLSKNAYNSCNKTSNNSIRECPVTQSYDTNTIRTYYRNNTSDSFVQKLKEKNSFSCYINVKVPNVTIYENNTGNGNTIFRNVDLNNLFPNGLDRENNWSTPEGQQAREEIEASSNSIITSDEYLEYSFELTPEAITTIKNYNKNKNYTDNSLRNCEIKDGKYFNCQSEFLNNIRAGGSTNYGIVVNKGDGISDYNKNK